MFLLMVFLRDFFDEAKTLHWLHPLEIAFALMLSRERALDQHHQHVPEWLTGLIGVVVLLVSFADSMRHRRRQAPS